MGGGEPGELSAEIRQRVIKAREFAAHRVKNAEWEESGVGGAIPRCNAELTPRQMRRFCTLDESGRRLLEGAFNRMGLSARGYDRILRVARTIADLDESEAILARHVAEAVQLRSLDRKYW